jgi:hypothetical protein
MIAVFNFVAYVLPLDVIAHSARCVQPPTGGIFICHWRRIESNFCSGDVYQCLKQILQHSKYEGTDFEELALDIGCHPMDQTDAGKLAREAGLCRARDHGLVPDQTKRSHDFLAI